MIESGMPALFETLKYGAFFLAAWFEGPVAMTVSGFLLRLGHVEFWPVYISLLLGDLAGDTMWYFLGRKYAHTLVKKYGKFLNIQESIIVTIEKAFERHHHKILLFSKMTMGLGFALPVIIAAGAARVPFRKFMLSNAAGQVIWTGILLAIGYFFGDFYLTLNKGFQKASLVAGVILLLLALHGFGKYIKNKKLYEKL